MALDFPSKLKCKKYRYNNDNANDKEKYLLHNFYCSVQQLFMLTNDN